MAIELYVYYRAAAVDAAAVQATVEQAQRGLCAEHPDLQARLLRRPQPTDGLHTWMEVYRWRSEGDAAPPDRLLALGPTIEDRLSKALGSRLVGTRHVEVFEPA
jgi:hypothetical protein